MTEHLDPVTTAAVAGAAGAATKQVVEGVMGLGQRWIAGRFGDHRPEVLATANANAVDFYNHLAARVARIEERVGDDAAERARIADVLNHPDFSATLHDALIAAVRSEDPCTRALLARMVCERLRAATGELLALAANLACEALPKLTLKQLRILALASFVYYVRPTHLRALPGGPETQAAYDAWILDRLGRLAPLPDVDPLERTHLQSVGCLVSEQAFLGRGLDTSMRMAFPSGWRWDEHAIVDGSELGQRLLVIWQRGLVLVMPTPVGQLIGLAVCDELFGTESVVDWSDDASA